MTLFKQIALLVSLIFLVLLGSITINDFQRSNKFLAGQLQTTAQDMATTLGITISNTIQGDDVAALETLFNAAFDSGYYSSIELLDPNGDLIHAKRQEVMIYGVPDWFVRLVPLQSAIGTTNVIQGWVPLGTLNITLHPGFSYASLYAHLKTTVAWFVILAAIGFVLLWYMLHIILQPLADLKKQADAIHNNEFITQQNLPKTTELKRVVEAMNRMVSKVRSIFEDQEKILARYQELLYKDKLTGLGNRKYMLTQLENTQLEDTSFNGCIAVLKMGGIEEIRNTYGYAAADNAVKCLANILSDKPKGYQYEKISRLGDDEFALLIPAEVSIAKEIISNIFEHFKIVRDSIDQNNIVSIYAGLTDVHSGRRPGDILADADFSLTQAQSKGPYSICQMQSTKLNLPAGRMEWRAWLRERMVDEGFYFAIQSVFDANKSVIQQEAFLRLKNSDNQTVPAGIFMPMAMALDFGLEIDKTVFELLKDAATKIGGEAPIAFNLSATFFDHLDAFEEFTRLLEFCSKKEVRLCVETSHNVIEQYPERCEQVSTKVKGYGHSFGIDNLNLTESLHALQDIRPNYIKVNAASLCNIAGEEMQSAYQTLRSLTGTLDIQLIAVGVDDEKVYEKLLEIGVDGIQGYLLEEPRDLN